MRYRVRHLVHGGGFELRHLLRGRRARRVLSCNGLLRQHRGGGRRDNQSLKEASSFHGVSTAVVSSYQVQVRTSSDVYTRWGRLGFMTGTEPAARMAGLA